MSKDGFKNKRSVLFLIDLAAESLNSKRLSWKEKRDIKIETTLFYT
jgi:hypothetical protein